jgi:hypothetical protein
MPWNGGAVTNFRFPKLMVDRMPAYTLRSPERAIFPRGWSWRGHAHAIPLAWHEAHRITRTQTPLPAERSSALQWCFFGLLVAGAESGQRTSEETTRFP